MIKGDFDFSNITRVVEDEYNRFWAGGTKETDPSVRGALSKYWNNLRGWNAERAIRNQTAWSAAYISWVMQQIDPTFPAAAAHYLYARAGLRNREQNAFGYKLYSLPRERRPILCQLGDVLVRPRDGGYTNSHGDVVYKIVGNTAYLAGGNLSNTNKINARVELNEDGTYKSSTPRYLVVLKRI